MKISHEMERELSIGVRAGIPPAPWQYQQYRCGDTGNTGVFEEKLIFDPRKISTVPL